MRTFLLVIAAKAGMAILSSASKRMDDFQ